MNQKTIKPDPLSLRSLFTDVLLGQTKLAIATGFVWKHSEDSYLITNHHVASGLDPATNQPIDARGTVPDRLVVYFLVTSGLSSWKPLEIELYDSQGRPTWLEHPHFKSKVDVVAIPIAPDDSYRVLAINDLEFSEFVIEISQDVFIIGYPRGVTGSGKLPIFKRGSIASEPVLDLDGVPKLLIDSATREGMSGSPVIAQYVGYYPVEPGTISAEDWFGTGRCFLGVYSGRNVGADELAAQLGIVWKGRVIEEIIEGGYRAE